jgi:O-antigen ligase
VRILTLTTLAQTRSLVSTAHDQGALWRRAGTGLFIALLLLASLIPGRFENSIVLFGVPVRVLEFLLVALAAVLVFLRLLQGPLPIPRDGYVPAVFSGLFAYAAVSLVWWSPVTQPDTSAMAMTLVLAAAALWSAYLVVRLQRQELHRFMSNLTTIIAGIAAIYSAQSFLGLGLRSEEGIYLDPLFGIDRVHGPLFAASLGGPILIPALAFALQEFIAGRSRPRNGLAVAVLLAASLGTGSRATVLGLGVMLVLGAFSLRTTRQRAAFGLIVLIVGGLAGGFVFSRVSTERLVNLQEEQREMTIRTGIRAVAQASIPDKVLGLGYASYWRWYLVDARGEGVYGFDAFFENRPAGVTLYHPHSTPLLLTVELGVPGLAAGLALIWALWRARTNGARNNMPTIAFAGIAGSAVNIVTDLVIFKAPFLNLVWWTYVFAAIALVETKACLKPPARQSAHQFPLDSSASQES